MAVGEQYRGRPQPVLGEHLGELVEHPDPRVDDEALLPGGGGDDVAVGAEGGRRESDDEHARDTTWARRSQAARHTT